MSKPKSNRCAHCRKKVGYLGLKCKCGHTYCSEHIVAESHNCTFDFKKAARELLAKQNPKVQARQLAQI